MAQPSFSGSNINLVKAHNLRAVLLTLLYEDSLSRVQLARRTSLSNTTITNIIAELQENGIVVEDDSLRGRSEESPPRSVGRPRTGLHLVPDARFAIGIHIGIGTIRVAVTNVCAELLHSQIIHQDIRLPAEEALEAIAALVEKTLEDSGVDRGRVLGIGVGASGLVDHRRGVNVLAPNLRWKDTPVRDILEKRLGLPVVVDNNVRTMALGEALFGSGRGANVLAFVYGRIGVGAGFVVDGQIYRGSAAGAGEIGHTTIIPEGGAPCRCGNTGCLETLVSEPALLKAAQDIAEQNPDGLLAQHLHQAGDDPVNRLFTAAREGDEEARAMLARRGHYLGIALANLVNVLNPELIILGGIFAQAEDLILPAVESTMRQRAFPHLGEAVRLQVTRFGWRAGVTGASALALANFFYQQPELL
jgi:glucokinase-like ROK family protein